MKSEGTFLLLGWMFVNYFSLLLWGVGVIEPLSGNLKLNHWLKPWATHFWGRVSRTFFSSQQHSPAANPDRGSGEEKLGTAGQSQQIVSVKRQKFYGKEGEVGQKQVHSCGVGFSLPH